MFRVYFEWQKRFKLSLEVNEWKPLPATARERTASVCPCSDRTRRNVVRSHTRMLQS